MINPATIERLLAVDTSSIRIPYYSKKTSSGENIDIYYLKNVLRFTPFCRDLDELNVNSRGFIVGRALVEAAWCKTVIKVYMRMDVEEPEREGQRFWNNLQCLNDCLRQRHAEGVLQYWMAKSNKYHNIDTNSQIDDENDHSNELAAWALLMLKKNTDDITNAQLTKQTKQMGHMNLDNDDCGDTLNANTAEDEQKQRAAATQQGLVILTKDRMELDE